VLAYRHPDRRKNNPEVGLVNAESDPEQPKTRWAYDPHLDPALQFDTARAQADALIADALAGNDPAAMRHALQTLQRMGAPYLQWTGKAERTSFDVDTVSLHVHERIDAMSILSSVSKRQNAMKTGAASADVASAGGQKIQNFQFQTGPVRGPVRERAPALGAGLLQARPGLGQPAGRGRQPAGDEQPAAQRRHGRAGADDLHRPALRHQIRQQLPALCGQARRERPLADADLTQEPEMIKAFRDTWELGIHSYLTYLRDRLLLARELLNDSGSVFVQISDENLHHVRELCDDVFGPTNHVSTITFRKTSGAGSISGKTTSLAGVSDYLVWYARDKSRLSYNQLYLSKEYGGEGASQYQWLEMSDGFRRRMTVEEKSNPNTWPVGAKVFGSDNLTFRIRSGHDPF
jgi:adenine-specific DNA-methyltransferase